VVESAASTAGLWHAVDFTERPRFMVVGSMVAADFTAAAGPMVADAGKSVR